MAPIVGNPPNSGGDYSTIDQKWLTALAGGQNQRVKTGIRAHPGGGQANGTPLQPGFALYQVDTVATSGDSLQLPVAVPPYLFVLCNAGANQLNVFAASSSIDTINGVAGSSALTIATNTSVIFACIEQGQWVTISGGGGGGIPGGTNGQVQFNNAGSFGGLTNTQLTADINVATAALSGAVPSWPNNTTTFFRGDGTYAIPPGVPGGSSGQVQTNSAGSFGGLTNIALTALINAFSATLSGAAPASGGGTTNFLRADGNWVPAAVAPAATGTPYYVSTGGNDSNTGLSDGQAWLTITKVNASTFLPGDTILFHGGQSFSGAIVCPSAGTPAAPIIFGSYGGDQATISSGNSIGFSSTNQAGIIVRDLTFTGTASTNYGIQFQNTNAGAAHLQNIQIINCIVSGYGRTGIDIVQQNVTGGVTAGYDDVLITGCTISGCCTVSDSGHGTAGIRVRARGGYGMQTLSNVASFNNVVISNCISHDNAGTSDTNWTGSGIVISEVRNGFISNCVAYNNGASSTGAGSGAVGIWTFDSDTVTIAECISHNNSSGSATDGDGFDLDGGCVNCTIRDCYSHDNFGCGFLVYSYSDGQVTGQDRCSIINCISDNDGIGAGANNTFGIVLNNDGVGTQTNFRIAGNTASCGTVSNPIFVGGGATGFVYDNTFIVTGTQYLVTSSTATPPIIFKGNRYISPSGFSAHLFATIYTSLAAWNAAVSTQEAQAAKEVATGIQFAGIPTSTQISAGNWGVFKDTSGGGVYVAYNDAGTIKKVALV